MSKKVKAPRSLSVINAEGDQISRQIDKLAEKMKKDQVRYRKLGLRLADLVNERNEAAAPFRNLI